MKTKNLLVSLVALTVLLFASTAMAQGTAAPNNALQAGQSALSFSVPSGGNPNTTAGGGGLFGLLFGDAGDEISLGTPALGYHYMFTNNLRGGIDLGLAMNMEGETAYNVLLAPRFNYYTSTVGTVAPYFFGGLRVGFSDDGNDLTDEETSIGAETGLGVEWFPVTRFSISGEVGLNLNLANPGFSFNLFTSGLAANIYF
jgi:hypothetical protein